MKQVWLKILIALLLSGLVFVIFISSQKAQPIIPRDNINSLANDALHYLISNDTSGLRSITMKENQGIWDNFLPNINTSDFRNMIVKPKKVEKGLKYTDCNGKEITKEEWNSIYDSIVTMYLSKHNYDKMIDQIHDDVENNILSETLSLKINEMTDKAHEEANKILPLPTTIYEDKFEIYIITQQNTSYKLTASTANGKYLLDGFDVIDGNWEER